MIEYFVLGGAVLLGAGMAIVSEVKNYKKIEQLNKKIIEDNEKIIPRIIEGFKAQDEKFHSIENKYLSAPRLSKEGIGAIREYCKTGFVFADSKKIIYKLLDEIQEREVEAKELGNGLEKTLIKVPNTFD